MAYFGIDLGTTNSLIGSGDQLYSGLVSSSVNVKTGKQCERDMTGEDIVSSYKTDMTIGAEGQLPIACSAVILKRLAELAAKHSGEAVSDIVVSVPAKFSYTQRQAVWEAASKAGLTIRGLVNEPTAAAVYVCRDLKDLILVFDLGGGTFDVTLIDSRAGNYYVIATEGLMLAGDDFDEAIMYLILQEMKIKTRYTTGVNKSILKVRVRQAKEALQRTSLTQYISLEGFGVESDYALTVETYVDVMKRVFTPALTLTQRVLSKNLTSYEIPKLVFVGGSTACPFLRAWIQDEINLDCVECDESPDFIVAKGVALYAEMLENGTAMQEVVDVTKRLCIEGDNGITFTIVDKNTNIPTSGTLAVSNKVESQYLKIALYQGDSIVASECEYVGTLMYDYGEVLGAGEGLVDLTVIVDRNGRIQIKGVNLLTGEEQSAEIIMEKEGK